MLLFIIVEICFSCDFKPHVYVPQLPLFFFDKLKLDFIFTLRPMIS